MPIVLPTGGAADALRYFVAKAQPDDLVLRLFTNDITPGDDDTARAYTEAKGYGYQAIQLRAADWTITEGPPAAARSGARVFTFTGPLGIVHGYYLTRAHNGRLAAAERFAQPYEIRNNGDRLRVAVTLTSAGKR